VLNIASEKLTDTQSSFSFFGQMFTWKFLRRWLILTVVLYSKTQI